MLPSLISLTDLPALRSTISKWRLAGYRIGFVPTMGNLHQGHLSLVEKAKQSCDKVIVSIFVNPLQFGPNEDFDRYPRTFDEDVKKLQSVGADAVFVPSVEEMYPAGLTQQSIVSVPSELTNILEGATRPGHFDGVTTVVLKLFNMVQPDVAVFGQKDLQQFRVIQKMVVDLCLPIEIIMGKIARDDDGLALSSRNQYLTETQRTIAPHLYQALQTLVKQLKEVNLSLNKLKSNAQEYLLNQGFDQVDYIDVVDLDSLISIEESAELPKQIAIVCVARLGKTRLLDNILLNTN